MKDYNELFIQDLDNLASKKLKMSHEERNSIKLQCLRNYWVNWLNLLFKINIINC
jgi:hypothetical protein